MFYKIKNLRQVFSIFICAVIILTSMPLNAVAQTIKTSGTFAASLEANGKTTNYKSFESAVAAAQKINGESVITLLSDITLTGIIEISSGDIIVDLNGNDIIFPEDINSTETYGTYFNFTSETAEFKIIDESLTGGFPNGIKIVGKTFKDIIDPEYNLLFISPERKAFCNLTITEQHIPLYISKITEENIVITKPDSYKNIYYSGEEFKNVSVDIRTVSSSGSRYTYNLTEGEQYSIEFLRNGVETADFTSAGVITFVVTGIDYNFTYTGSYEIRKIKKDFVATSPNKTYDGYAQPVIKGLYESDDEERETNLLETPGEYTIEFSTGTGEVIVTAHKVDYSNVVWNEDWSAQVPMTSEPGKYFPYRIRITRPNYEDVIWMMRSYTFYGSPTLEQAPTASSIEYGQTLADAKITGGKVVNENNTELTVEGSWSWADNTVQPLADGSFDAIFTESEPVKHNQLENQQINVNVTPTRPIIDFKLNRMVALPGDSISVESITASNPHDSTLTDGLPTLYSIKYRIGEGPLYEANNEVIVPEDTPLGTVITFYATSNSVSGKYYSVESTATVTVCEYMAFMPKGTVAGKNGEEVTFDSKDALTTYTANDTTPLINFTLNFAYEDNVYEIDISEYTYAYSSNSITPIYDFISTSNGDMSVSPFDIYWSAYRNKVYATEFECSYSLENVDYDAIFEKINTATGLNLTSEKNSDILNDVFSNNYNLGTFTCKIAQRGDANLDGVVDTKDAALISKYQIEFSTLPEGSDGPTLNSADDELAKFAADINSDTSIDTKDAANVAKYAIMYASYPSPIDVPSTYYKILKEIGVLN